MEDECRSIKENIESYRNVPLKKMVKDEEYIVILPKKGSFPHWNVDGGIVLARFGFKASWPFSEKDEYYFLVVKVYSGEAKVEQLLTLQECGQKFDIEDRSGFMIIERLDEYPTPAFETDESDSDTDFSGISMDDYYLDKNNYKKIRIHNEHIDLTGVELLDTPIDENINYTKYEMTSALSIAIIISFIITH